MLHRNLKRRTPISDLFGPRAAPGLPRCSCPIDERATRRRLPAPARLPRRRARPSSTGEIAEHALGRRGRAAADDDPRHRRHHRGDADGAYRRRPPLPDRRATWSATSGCTRRSASRATGPPATAASPSRARPPPATCSSRPPGRRPRAPGPLRAFAQRTAARRGRHVATVAVARKLAVLAWHLLTRGEDYAFQRPSLVRAQAARARAQGRRAARQARPATADPRLEHRDRRRREAPRRAGRDRLPAAGRRLAGQRPEGGCGRDTGARISKALEGQGRAAGHKLLTPALRHVSHPHPTRSVPQGARTRQAV